MQQNYFFVAFLRSVPQLSPVSELCMQFHELMSGFLLWCVLSAVITYRDRCMNTFPNHVQSIELTTGGLSIKVQKQLKDDQEKWSKATSHNSVITKGLNTYVNGIFKFFLLNTFANISKSLLWCIECELMRGQSNLNSFCIRLQQGPE